MVCPSCHDEIDGVLVLPKSEASPPEPLTLARLRAVNVRRCEEVFFHLGHWMDDDWLVALVGEIGEVANVIKKIKRDNNPPGDPGTWRKALSDELADVLIYFDLLLAAREFTWGDVTSWHVYRLNDIVHRMGGLERTPAEAAIDMAMHAAAGLRSDDVDEACYELLGAWCDIALHFGIDTEGAVVAKFNEVSSKKASKQVL